MCGDTAAAPRVAPPRGCSPHRPGHLAAAAVLPAVDRCHVGGDIIGRSSTPAAGVGCSDTGRGGAFARSFAILRGCVLGKRFGQARIRPQGVKHATVLLADDGREGLLVRVGPVARGGPVVVLQVVRVAVAVVGRGGHDRQCEGGAHEGRTGRSFGAGLLPCQVFSRQRDLVGHGVVDGTGVAAHPWVVDGVGGGGGEWHEAQR
mmetsp:Transcript_13918/g.35655  ORF Transcript_13918/g.35655 Transcript_13918/m.35655 type:complete len:204 (-) Transcript_13918:30-641(-)